VTKINCACPAGAASAIHVLLPLDAPISGNVACVKASRRATTNANWPISGIIFVLATKKHKKYKKQNQNSFVVFVLLCGSI
jgi:hypothetical protein